MALINGTGVAEILSGTASNDILSGLAGNDTLQGGAGSDMAVFTGTLQGHLISVSSGQLTVSDNVGSDGADVLKEIEKLYFSTDGSQLMVSQESIVNTFTAGAQTKVTNQDLSSGGYLSFWQSDDGYYVKKFDASGHSVSTEVRLPSEIGVSSGVEIAMLTNDNFALTWNAPDGKNSGVFVQVFNTDGVATSEKIHANSTLTGDQTVGNIVGTADGGFTVFWRSQNQSDSTIDPLLYPSTQYGSTSNTDGMFVQHFDAFGKPFGFESKLNPYAGANYSVDALSNGNFVVTYEAINSTTKDVLVVADIYDTFGNIHHSTPIINTSPETSDNTLADESKLPQVAALTGGNFVVVWQAPVDTYVIPAADVSATPTTVYDRSIMLRLFDANGSAISVELKANTFSTYEQSKPAVAALADGGFVVTWQSLVQDQSYWGIYAQRFDAGGNKVGNEFQVNTKTEDSQEAPSVVGLADGGFVISWQSEYQDGNQQGVYQDASAATEIVQQRYDANGNKLGMTFSGTALDDDSKIGGTDSIELDAAQGNDSLVTGTGDDTLRGGLGNDSLDGGLGANILLGGVGDDTYVVNSTQDQILEQTDQGKDSVISNVDFTLTNNLENLTLIASAKLATGNQLSNLIIGNTSDNNLIGDAGADTLSGAAGNDSLDGGQGNDVLNGDAGNDTLVGDAGDDTLTGGSGNDSLVGGDGNDIFILTGKMTDYAIVGEAGSYTVSDLRTAGTSDGIDHLVEIEKIQFSDLLLNLDGSFDTTPGVNLQSAKTVAEVLNGTGSNDTLSGGGNSVTGLDTLQGGAGNDVYIALGNALLIYDTKGIDTLVESFVSIDLTKPIKGNIKGLEDIENITLTGKKALNLVGSDVDNQLTGNDASNTIKGQLGNDILFGGAGNDTIFGGDGDDTLYAGLGRDRLAGEVGNDVFVFDTKAAGNNADVIVDFNADEDMIKLESSVFSGLFDADNGGINFQAEAGKKAADVDTASFMIYDTKSGNLYYDAAGAKSILVAKLLPIDKIVPSLSEDNFELFSLT